MENTKNYIKQIIKTLNYAGVPANISGYEYLKAALQLVLNNPDIMKGTVTKQLYPAIAEKCGSTASRVERGIRHAVCMVYDRLPPDKIEDIFGNCTHYGKGKTTNSEFIAILAERIRLESGEYD